METNKTYSDCENIGIITVHNADCIEIMARYSDKYFDLAVIDTPYGIKESGATNKTRSKIAKSKDCKPFVGDDLLPPDRQFFQELKRISKNQVIFGANHFIENIPSANSPS